MSKSAELPPRFGSHPASMNQTFQHLPTVPVNTALSSPCGFCFWKLIKRNPGGQETAGWPFPSPGQPSDTFYMPPSDCLLPVTKLVLMAPRLPQRTQKTRTPAGGWNLLHWRILWPPQHWKDQPEAGRVYHHLERVNFKQGRNAFGVILLALDSGMPFLFF